MLFCPPGPKLFSSMLRNYDAHRLCTKSSKRCHGLAPWSFSCLLLNRIKNQSLQMPRPCAVEPHVCCYVAVFSFEREPSTAQGRGIQSCCLKSSVVATSVKFHGTSPWHLFRLFVQSHARIHGDGITHMEAIVYGFSCTTA